MHVLATLLKLFVDTPVVLNQSFCMKRFRHLIYLIRVRLGAIEAILAWHLQPIASSAVHLIASNLYRGLVELPLQKLRECRCQIVRHMTEDGAIFYDSNSTLVCAGVGFPLELAATLCLERISSLSFKRGGLSRRRPSSHWKRSSTFYKTEGALLKLQTPLLAFVLLL